MIYSGSQWIRTRSGWRSSESESTVEESPPDREEVKELLSSHVTKQWHKQCLVQAQGIKGAPRKSKKVLFVVRYSSVASGRKWESFVSSNFDQNDARIWLHNARRSSSKDEFSKRPRRPREIQLYSGCRPFFHQRPAAFTFWMRDKKITRDLLDGDW